MDEIHGGFYVETWGGGRYNVVSYHATLKEAEKELACIIHSGRWSGMKPRIVPVESLNTRS